MHSVAICSGLRADSDYETAYYMQILGMARNCFRIDSVNVIYDREPESSRWARDLLESHGIRVRYAIEIASGGVAFPTIEHKARQWAAISNQCIELAMSGPDAITHIAAIEADLSYPYDTLEVLLARDKPIIAPMIYLNNVFYDTWGFRDLNGARLSGVPPVLPLLSNDPVELSSVGSFVLFDAAVFRAGVRSRGEYENGLLVGVCQDAGKLGFKTFMDPTISIMHPVGAWRNQCWSLATLTICVDGVSVSQAKLSNVMVAGPFELFVRPFVDGKLDPHFHRSLQRTYTIETQPGTKRLNVTVNISSEPASAIASPMAMAG